jgi:hypothetical protein
VKKGLNSFGIGSAGAGGGTNDAGGASGAGGGGRGVRPGMPSKLDFDKARRMMNGGDDGGSKLSKLF